MNLTRRWVAGWNVTAGTGVDPFDRHVTDSKGDLGAGGAQKPVLPESRHPIDFKIRPKAPPRLVEVTDGEPGGYGTKGCGADDGWPRRCSVVGEP